MTPVPTDGMLAMTQMLSVAAAVLMMTPLQACSPHGCKTSTDPATCATTEDVNAYNRQRQLDRPAPLPGYPRRY